LKKLLSRAREIGDKLCFIDDPTAKLLRHDELKVSEYLQLDDVSMTYHIKRWVSDKDPVLSDLSSRFINRRLLKAVKLPGSDPAQQQEIVERARRIVEKRGLNPDYYVATESTGLRPYDYYRPDADHPQTNIMVRMNNGEVRELSTLSTPVEALVKGDFETYCLVYPDEVAEEIALLFEPAACH
jgi:HD superfamily phosphohydrolase